MYFVIYKNSVLASICSIFGAAFIALAVTSMISGELGILPGIGVIAAGFGLMCLARVISERKAKKKQAKAARAASYVTQASTVFPSTATAVGGNPVNKCAVFAGSFFLLAALLNWWAAYLYNTWKPFYMLDSETVMLIAMGLLLMIAAFRTRHIQKVSILFVLGFLGLTWGSIDVAMMLYEDFGFGGYSDSTGIYYTVLHAPLLRVAGFFLMTVFSLLSMEKIKEHLGGIVKWLWFIPIPLLLLAYVKDIGDSYVLELLDVSIEKGFQFPPRAEFLEAIAKFLVIWAVCFTGFCFQRICKTPAAVYAQPEFHYTDPEPLRQPPQPRYTAPEPPKQTEQVNDPDVQKKIQAYRDLLELGILSQEEYDQKIRELMRGW